jgi:predicted short-subunit dehydrogenase-like oxidoreductase (DUF2520 family)
LALFLASDIFFDIDHSGLNDSLLAAKMRPFLHTITIIGAGRVGTSMAIRMCERQIPVTQIHSRTHKHAQALAVRVGAKAIAQVADLQLNNATIVLLCVQDAEIEYVAKSLSGITNGALVVHTSGVYAVQDLADILPRVGGLYPIMTFGSELPIRWSKLPFGIFAPQALDQKILISLANRVGGRHFILFDDQRTSLHVAAVFANNFTNHLFQIAFRLLDSESMDRSILTPLIQRTLTLIENAEPKSVQTGPAIRRDEITIGRHLEKLAGEPEVAELYKLLTKLIQK